MNGIIEIELQDTPQIDAVVDFKGEVIRADADALKKEYDSGYNDGYALGDHEGYERGLSEGYTDGHADGYLPMYLTVPEIKIQHFFKTTFPQGYELSLRFKKCANLNSAFRECTGVKSISLVIDEPISTDMQFCFRQTSAEIIDLTGWNVTPQFISYCFYQAKNLRSIIGALDLSKVGSYIGYWLEGCTLLENISIVPESIKASTDFYWCGNLSAESIESIINGLADLTGSAAQNVSLHTVIINKLTTEQMDRITAKNWVLN